MPSPWWLPVLFTSADNKTVRGIEITKWSSTASYKLLLPKEMFYLYRGMEFLFKRSGLTRK